MISKLTSYTCEFLVLRPANPDKGKGIMLEDEANSSPILGLTMGPIRVGVPEKAKVAPAESDSSSDESIFLGGCKIG